MGTTRVASIERFEPIRKRWKESKTRYEKTLEGCGVLFLDVRLRDLIKWRAGLEPRPTDSALGVLLADGQKSLHTLAELGFMGQSRDPNFWDR